MNGDDLDPERLLARGGPLEGHSDNLAAALAGGVCLTWEGRIARIAETLPFTAVAVVPKSRVRTAEARLSLPDEVSHRAAAFTAAHAALLGAGAASGDPELFAAALADELHEPYRAANAPALQAVRGGTSNRRGRRHDLRLGPDRDRVGQSRAGRRVHARARTRFG